MRVDGVSAADLAAGVLPRVVLVWAPVSTDACTARWRARGACRSGVTGPKVHIGARGGAEGGEEPETNMNVLNGLRGKKLRFRKTR
jgi:hypothetical protein